MLHKRLIPSAVVVVALAAPSAAIAQTDLRSPDARDAAAAAIESAAPQDLRAPDTRDAAAGVVRSAVPQDLRAPDTRDAALASASTSQSVPAVQTVTRDDGFEWGSAGIGAAAMLAIVLALAAGAALIVPRRRMRTPMAH